MRPPLDADEPEQTFRAGRLLRGWVVLVAGDIGTTFVNLATVILITRRLGVSDFGVYSFSVAFSSFAVFFTDLGVDAITTRELAASSGADEGLILGSAVVVKAVLVALTVVGSLAVLLAYRPSLRLAAAIGIVGLVSTVPGELGLLLTAKVRVVGRAVVSLVAAVVSLVATATVLHISHSPLGPVIVLSVSTAGVAFAYAALAHRVRRSRLQASRAWIRRISAAAAPVGLSAVGVAVYRRADQLLLAAFGQVAELGRYSAAVRLVDALNLVPLGLASVALPALAHFRNDAVGHDRHDRLATMGYRFLAAVILPLAALGTLGGGVALSVVYGHGYRPAGAALSVLLWAHYFGFTGVMADQVLIARGQSAWLAALTGVGALSNVAANFYLIPRYGGLGAAWASLLAYAIPFIGGLLVRPVRDVFAACLGASIRPAIASGMILGVLLLVRPSDAALLPWFVPTAIGALLLTRSVTIREGSDMVRALLGRAAGEVRP